MLSEMPFWAFEFSCMQRGIGNLRGRGTDASLYWNLYDCRYLSKCVYDGL